jgi:hypothetical protein
MTSSLKLVEVKAGTRFPVAALRRVLKDPKAVARFVALYRLDEYQTGALLRLLFPDSPVVQALVASAHLHSGSLQGFIVELGYENKLFDGTVLTPEEEVEPEPDTDLLAQMFEQLQVKVADNIAEVADQLADTLVGMPGKEGRMRMKSLLKLDRRIKRKLGVHQAQIQHAHKPDNLVVFDTSGSIGEKTTLAIAAPVVAMAVKANAHLVIVSDGARWWKPGEISVEAVLGEAEYAGTHYETLSPLFDRDWGVVVSVADYDSSYSSKEAIADCTGRIQLLLDISLVERPTFLAECLEQLADETRPLMVAKASLTHAY